jgi:cytochrome c551/c552
MQTKLAYAQRINRLLALFLLLLIYNISSTAQKSPEDNFKTCAACHSIGKGRLVGPDLKGVTEKYEEAWLIKFIQSSQTMVKNGDERAVKIFEEFKIPMPDNNLSDDEVKALLEYIKNYDPNAVAKTKPAVKADPNFLENDFSYLPKNTKGIFYISLVLLLLSIFDLAVTKVLKKAKAIHIMIIGSTLFLISMVVYQEAVNLGRYPGYEPDQPIKFSHKVHAGDNKIDCQYCHTGVMESKRAGIPSENVCLNCHTVIKSGTNTGTSEIAKIYKAVEEGKAIEWIKVHNLPDHVFYSHAQHVNAGKLDCTECHGDVAKMGRIQQVNDLSMGWCLDCHRKKHVDFDNKYYSNQFKKYHEEIKNGHRKGVTVSEIGGQDCAKCHY